MNTIIKAESALEPASQDLAWRIIRSTNLIRFLVGAVLLGVFLGINDPPVVGTRFPLVFGALATAYLAYSVFTFALVRSQWLPVTFQTYQQVTVDIVVLTVLMHASGGINSGIGGLLIIFVAAAVLTRPTQNLYVLPALAAIALLTEQLFSQLSGTTTASQYTASGLLGAIVLAIPLIAGPLSRRISENEILLAQRGVDLANMSRLNQYIVQHLRESILALDSNDEVRLINESAAQLLGAPPESSGIALAEFSPELAAKVSTFRDRTLSELGTNAQMTSRDGSSVINISFAPLAHPESEAPPLLIFLEDTSLLAERVQQSKLASLGRLSASIAHEIRNPVGAMSHAGQLLAESIDSNESQQRLIDIILSHSARVSTIIENILQLSRRDTGQREQLTLLPWLSQFADEFVRTLELNESELVIARGDIEMTVLIDPSHLRQVLWNLCDNAVKYASDSGGILVEISAGRVESSGRPYLDVADHGSGIPDHMIDHIFEPFFTAQKGGTGLGLFISRELCELNRAALSYRPNDGKGSIFRIVFSDPTRWSNEDKRT